MPPRPSPCRRPAPGPPAGLRPPPRRAAGAEAMLAAPLAAARPPPRPADTRCTADGTACIALATYVADVCRSSRPPPRPTPSTSFFARLLWKESLFDAAAVSPAGAQGIAQFMPGTAKLRGLSDAFNPAEALYASAAYLAELATTTATSASPPRPTTPARPASTASSPPSPAFPPRPAPMSPRSPAIRWRPGATHRRHPRPRARPGAGDGTSRPPASPAPSSAASREFRSVPKLAPWGVVVASNREIDGAERQVSRLRNRFATVLAGEEVAYSSGRSPGLRTGWSSPRSAATPRRGRHALRPPPRRRRRLHGPQELGPRPRGAPPRSGPLAGARYRR